MCTIICYMRLAVYWLVSPFSVLFSLLHPQQGSYFSLKQMRLLAGFIRASSDWTVPFFLTVVKHVDFQV